MKTVRGLLITLEGIEGSGKSTQLTRLAAYLTQRGYKVAVTREPGGTPFGEQIRHVLLSAKNQNLDPRAELFLYLASRTQHLEEVILPSLREGIIVLCDRFSDATLAYQGFGRGLDRSFVKEAVIYAAKGLRADLTLLLDLEVNRGLSRMHGRGAANRLDREDLEFHRRVREGYLKLARASHRRIRVVDASPGIETVALSIQKIVAEHLEHHPPNGERRLPRLPRIKRLTE